MANDTQIMLGIINSDKNIWDVKDAGTCMRFLTSYATLLGKEITITGTNRMFKRPIKILIDSLNSIGAKIEYLEKEGYPPLKVHPQIPDGGEINVDSSVSSQYITALLLIANQLKKGLILNLLNESVSSPYVDLTISLMNQVGINVVKLSNQLIVKPYQKVKSQTVHVEGDWSAAAFWYQISLLSLCSEISLVGLKPNSCQGDSVLPKLFRKLGVHSQFKDESLLIRQDPLENYPSYFEADFLNYPDIVPSLVCALASLKIKAKLTGLKTLKLKSLIDY